MENTLRTPIYIFGGLLLPDILLKSCSEKFWKILKKTILKKSCVNNEGDRRPETLLKHNLSILKQVIYVAYYADNDLFNRNSSQSRILREF